MRMLVKPCASVLLGAGIVLLAYVTLSPAIWSRATLDLVPLGATMVAGRNLAFELSFARSQARPETSHFEWLFGELVEAIVISAAFIVIGVLLGGVSPADNLSTTAQKVVFGISCMLVPAFWLRNRVVGRRTSAAQDAERERRLEAARAQARRNVAQYMEEHDPTSTPGSRGSP